MASRYPIQSAWRGKSRCLRPHSARADHGPDSRSAQNTASVHMKCYTWHPVSSPSQCVRNRSMRIEWEDSAPQRTDCAGCITTSGLASRSGGVGSDRAALVNSVYIGAHGRRRRQGGLSAEGLEGGASDHGRDGMVRGYLDHAASSCVAVLAPAEAQRGYRTQNRPPNLGAGKESIGRAVAPRLRSQYPHAADNRARVAACAAPVPGRLPGVQPPRSMSSS